MNWKLSLLIGLMMLLSIALNPTLGRVTNPSFTIRKEIGNIHMNKGMKIGFRGSVSRSAHHGNDPPNHH
ncbi:unnamed protein product [Eruca vesicaria subsp. sativa]|uniref:Uncharacterized protein n=1 Tax=Eruca vesicaria subsp. sativa TaxID=29727 RepID=A0ABC8JZE5_ERUVS|nr:unnamed protein product [Eruca vesicaria subsp. sativa]